MRRLGLIPSLGLRALYRAPDFPGRMRLWSWLRRSVGWARLTLPYGRRGVITLDERDYLQQVILTEGFYEPEVWRALAERAHGGEVFWDVGAHIGAVTLLALQEPRVRVVYSFEPDPLTREVLDLHLELNRASSVSHACALGGAAGQAELERGPSHNTGQTKVRLNPEGQGQRVDIRTIDGLVTAGDLKPPTLLKIDVEGLEGEVIRGARQTLRNGELKAIVFEAESDGKGGLRDRSLGEVLEESGYLISHLSRPERRIESRENYVAVPRSE
jgi:FkbM family methyltransferase